MSPKKYLLNAILFSLCITSNLNAAPVIIAFTRHTFRGIDKLTPPPAITISNLKIQNTILSYGENATHSGLAITKKFAESAYNNGAKLALKTIGEKPDIAGHWAIIRADLAQERTFSTAVYLYKGLSKNNSPKISLVGCRTSEAVPVDYISTGDHNFSKCIAPYLSSHKNNSNQSIISEKFIMLANHLITLLGGKPNINADNLTIYFSSIKLLSDQIEMSSDLGMPLNAVLEKNTITSPQINHEAVTTAMQLLGYSLFENSSNLEMQALTLLKANYIDSLKGGTQEIIVTHDTKMNALLNNLGFLTKKSSPNEFSVYPIETITIAMNEKKVAIVRTRINIRKDGSMTGAAGFKSWVFWSGPRKQWNAHVAALREKVNHEKRIAACVQKATLCHAVLLQLKQ